MTPQINKCKECDSDHVKLPLPLDTGNDEKKGVKIEISKQPRCDHRYYMKERTDILDKLRRF